MFEVTVNTRRAVVGAKELITTSSAGIQVQFTFSEDWDELAKFAIFRNSDEGQEVAVALPNSNLTVIPAQSCSEDYVDEPLFVGVYGTDGLGAVIIPTIWTSLGVLRPGAVTTDIITPPEPTPDMWAQILAIANEAAAIADECEANEELRVAVEQLRADAETARANAETLRVAAEASRAENENERRGAETQRQDAEDARAQAEALRVQAEELRQANETSRVSAESDRVSAEQTRQSQETTRASNEAARVAAEQLRAQKEAARNTAEEIRSGRETARYNNEFDRMAAETQRSRAEEARATAEADRVTAENNRVSAEQSRVNAEADRVTAETNRATEFATWESTIASKVPNTRTINGKALSADITLDSGDIAYDDSETYQSGTAGAALNDLNRQLSDTKSEITQLDKDININLVSGYEANRSILANGSVTTSSGTNLYYADVEGLSNVLVTGGSLYGFFNTVPQLGAIAIDNARHETSTVMNNEKIALPTGTKYLAVRNSTKPIIRNADTSNFVTASATEYTGDFNALLQNSVVTRTSNGATIASNHAPIDGFVGTILTFGLINTNAFRTQIAIYGGNASRYWWRQYYTAWSSWQEVATLNELVSKVSIRTTEYTGDFNDLQPGNFATRTSNGSTVSTNHVPFDGFVGSVITVGIPNLNYFKGQIAICGGTGKHMYWRQYYTAWGKWSEIASTNYVNDKGDPLDILPSFDNITCCGDSLTQSIVYTSSSNYRPAKVPYPKALEKMTGTPVEYYATGGYTAINWWNAYAGEIVEKENQVAIIYLGTNGGLTDTLSTDAPEETDYSTWANTNTGCYAKMIAKFKAVGAKVILVMTYAGPSNPGVETTNNVITQMADRFHCGLVSNTMLADNVYSRWPNGAGTGSPHYNDLGYCAFARYLLNQIARMNSSYLQWLIPGND